MRLGGKQWRGIAIRAQGAVVRPSVFVRLVSIFNTFKATLECFPECQDQALSSTHSPSLFVTTSSAVRVVLYF